MSSYMRHNSLEDLVGVEVVNTLETVDVSGNFITSLGDLSMLVLHRSPLVLNRH